jgi:hypothetical protein
MLRVFLWPALQVKLLSNNYDSLFPSVVELGTAGDMLALHELVNRKASREKLSTTLTCTPYYLVTSARIAVNPDMVSKTTFDISTL